MRSLLILQSYQQRPPFDDDAVIGSRQASQVTVYQAFNHAIADEAIRLQKFGPNFRLTRMSWIKPSFLWMMYRAGWGTKDSGQNRILAIDIPWAFLEELVDQAVLAIDSQPDRDVIIQMDPDRDPAFRPLARRALQMGLRGEALRRYAQDEIVKIEDITALALENKQRFEAGDLDSIQVPCETGLYSYKTLLERFSKP